MFNSLRRLWVCSIILLLNFFILTFKVSASEDIYSPVFQAGKHRPTIVAIEQPGPFFLGDHPTIIVHLTTYTHREPIANQPIRIYINDVQKATGYTDSNGIAYVELKYKFSSGTYEVRATFPGSSADDLNSSTDTKKMLVENANVVIRTVPAITGVRVVINSQTYTSNDKGIIQFNISNSGMYHMKVLEIGKDVSPPDVSVRFERWNDNVFEPERVVYLPRSRPLEIGFILAHPVNQRFYDSSGQQIESSRITSISIGGIGRIHTFMDPGPHWLPSNRLVHRIGERLESQQILYYVRNVSIDGVNAINQSEQRFYARPQLTWSIKVLLYSAHFASRDALFNFPIGTGVQIEYPNGRTKKFPFDEKAEVNVPALARGGYNVRVIGAGGSAPIIPVYLSRDQSVQLIVISYLDMAVIFGIPIIAALALLFIGRPRLFLVLRNSSQPKAVLQRIFRRKTIT